MSSVSSVRKFLDVLFPSLGSSLGMSSSLGPVESSCRAFERDAQHLLVASAGGRSASDASGILRQVAYSAYGVAQHAYLNQANRFASRYGSGTQYFISDAFFSDGVGMESFRVRLKTGNDDDAKSLVMKGPLSSDVSNDDLLSHAHFAAAVGVISPFGDTKENAVRNDPAARDRLLADIRPFFNASWDAQVCELFASLGAQSSVSSAKGRADELGQMLPLFSPDPLDAQAEKALTQSRVNLGAVLKEVAPNAMPSNGIVANLTGFAGAALSDSSSLFQQLTAKQSLAAANAKVVAIHMPGYVADVQFDAPRRAGEVGESFLSSIKRHAIDALVSRWEKPLFAQKPSIHIGYSFSERSPAEASEAGQAFDDRAGARPRTARV